MANEQDTRFVQSVSAAIRDSAQMNSKVVLSVARGTELSVLETNGLWLKVTVDNKTGWVSKLLVGRFKPVGHTVLNKTVDNNIEKASRRRPTSYAVSAAARGLMTNERSRFNQERYKSDASALNRMETRDIKPEALEKFRQAGKLSFE